MKIEIIGSRPILAIQQEFNRVFPLLKIEFFTRSHTKGKPTSAKFIVKPGKFLRDFGVPENQAELEITGDTTVFELEKTFRERFSLNVQVFRKSGRIWLETTATDDWTLDSQNEQGKELTEGSYDKGELPDYHEQE